MSAPCNLRVFGVLGFRGLGVRGSVISGFGFGGPGFRGSVDRRWWRAGRATLEQM